MRVLGRITLLIGLCLGVVITMAAQNASGKRSSSHARHAGRHTSSSAAVPDESKRLNSDLTKLENKGTKLSRPAHPAPRKAIVPSSKSGLQDRQGHNPPISFTYKGTVKSSSSRGTGASRPPAPMGKLR
jgi:hypothetical protein